MIDQYNNASVKNIMVLFGRIMDIICSRLGILGFITLYIPKANQSLPSRFNK